MQLSRPRSTRPSILNSSFDSIDCSVHLDTDSRFRLESEFAALDDALSPYDFPAEPAVDRFGRSTARAQRRI